MGFVVGVVALLKHYATHKNDTVGDRSSFSIYYDFDFDVVVGVVCAEQSKAKAQRFSHCIFTASNLKLLCHSIITSFILSNLVAHQKYMIPTCFALVMCISVSHSKRTIYQITTRH